MAIGLILGIIIFIAIVGFAIWSYYLADNFNTTGSVITCVIAIVLALAFIIAPFSFHTVNSGELAVVKHLGKITHSRTAGTNFDLWMINSYQKYDAKVQTVDLTFSAYSADAQTMDVAMTLQYQIIPDKVIDIATQYGSLDILESRITSISIEKAKSVLSIDKAMDIIANRSQMSPAVEEAIKDAIGESYYVNVVAAVLTDITFTDAFELAVEEKMIAEQKQLQAHYENQTKIAQAEADASSAVKKAEGEAESKLKAAQAEIEIAKARAEAKLIEAEAQAEANKIISNSITDEIIEKTTIDKWNGELPSVITGGESSIMIPPVTN